MTKRPPITESLASSAGGEPARADQGGRASRGPGARRAAGSNPEHTMSKIVTVDFQDDTLFAVEAPEGVFVAIKPISDRLGLTWGSQHNRLLRDPILAEGISVMKMPSPGGAQDTTLLRLDLINGWLFGIDVDRARPEIRDRVLAYKRECYAALHGHFYGRKAEVPAVVPDSIGKRRQLVTECRHSHGIKAAQELWRKLDLPMVPAMGDPGLQSTLGFTYGNQGGK